MNKVFCIVFGILLSSSAFAFTIFSQPEITAYWQQSAGESTARVDHADWTDLLGRYVTSEDGINLFAYGSVTPKDKATLDHYVEYLQSIEVTQLNRQGQFAYWINLYNALTVQVVLEHYPINSILEISYGLLSNGPWKEELIDVEGMALSLDNIEHQILRPIFDDNRIHFAVNCASMGCPNIQNQAFTAENLESLLQLGAVSYVNHPRGISIEGGELILSSIFDWYGDDFGDDENEILDELAGFAEPELRNVLGELKSIDDYHYDWSLNE